jgi:colanic acid biosynthesis glycosyl transferase WcaI
MHSAADVFLLPTAPGMGASSVPSKLITYLAMSRPVVACAIPGSELATAVEEEGVGWVVPPADALSFAVAIRHAKGLGAGPRADMGIVARRLAVSRHSTESAIERFSKLFQEAVTSTSL